MVYYTTCDDDRVPSLVSRTLYSPVPRIGFSEESHGGMGQTDGMTRGRPVCQLLDVTSSFHRSRCPFSFLRLRLGCSSPSFVSLVHPYHLFSRHPHDIFNFFP